MLEVSTSLLPSFLIIFLAAITYGLTGFGFALVSVPLLILFLDPKTAIPLVLLLNTAINFVVLIQVWKNVSFKRILPLLIAGVIGIPIGTMILLFLDASTLKILVGLLVALTALALILGFRREIKNKLAGFAITGFVSGILNGSTTMSGPPVVLFLANQGTKKDEFRADLVAYFSVLFLLTLPFHFAGGLLTPQVINYSILLLPAMIIGAVGGMALVSRVNDDLFRKISLVLVLVSGIVALASGFGLI